MLIDFFFFFLKTASDGLKWVICLTFSHDSVGCSTRWNRISAKAGCFSIALQLKLRLFFAQDMEMFCGASYLTVKQKVVFFLHNFVYVFAFVHYICTDIAAETEKTGISVFSVNLQRSVF